MQLSLFEAPAEGLKLGSCAHFVKRGEKSVSYQRLYLDFWDRHEWRHLIMAIQSQSARGRGTTMTKKDIVALAEVLRSHNRTADGRTEFTPDHLRVLADFLASQYPNFNQKRWIDYVAGDCGQGDEWIFAEPDSIGD